MTLMIAATPLSTPGPLGACGTRGTAGAGTRGTNGAPRVSAPRDGAPKDNEDSKGATNAAKDMLGMGTLNPADFAGRGSKGFPWTRFRNCLIISTLFFAISKTFALSFMKTCICGPQFPNSLAKTSSSSSARASYVSGEATRIFCNAVVNSAAAFLASSAFFLSSSTWRRFSSASFFFCSSRRFFSSSRCFLSASSRCFRFSSSSLRRFSSSCCFAAICCCWCCWCCCPHANRFSSGKHNAWSGGCPLEFAPRLAGSA
mmetsp:Transcript_105010/g.295750  ORF Transcript_105010/g.295750 Transcript_105010/m.295750 type:complete len:258 (+) Transcript_105010:537-1310(+)